MMEEGASAPSSIITITNASKTNLNPAARAAKGTIMPNETKLQAINVATHNAIRTSSQPASVWRRLPPAVKCIILVPVTMVLLGAEIELHLAPQLDVILTIAGALGMWTWLSGP
jgi:hypothetical protein